MENNKIKSVEGIRGIACIMVFISHLSSTFFPAMHSGLEGDVRSGFELFVNNSPFAFFYSGSAAVSIFFVLSGFILSHVILNSKDVVLSASSMFIKRYFRLMPVSVFSCILAYFVFSFFAIDNSSLGLWSINYNIKKPELLSAIYDGAVSAFMYGGADYNWSLWTMKIELFGSFIVFFICMMMPKIKYKKTMVLLISMLPFFLALKQRDDIYYSIFILGVLISLVKMELGKKTAITIFLVGLFFCGYHGNNIIYSPINDVVNIKISGRRIDNYTLFNALGAFLVVFSTIKSFAISNLFSNKFFVSIGTLSFSIYAIHQPVMRFVCPYFFNLFNKLNIGYTSSSLLSLILCIIIVMCLSVFVYKYIDKKSVIISNKFRDLIIIK
ncbi:acyltransferase family protein [Proteus sp. G2667]|uniref:acyltransferase family protein n=1 Tax=Proteus sp. G2667 TaxID=2698880 RepID=UPI0013788813|nr:acyltransferase [Proteus sp. G2667]NBM59153.1 acyltransferase family protein [Proteus sp. G2667]